MSAAIEAVDSELIQDGNADTLAVLGVADDPPEGAIGDVLADVDTVDEVSVALMTGKLSAGAACGTSCESGADGPNHTTGACAPPRPMNETSDPQEPKSSLAFSA
ncbi:hypothetical protein [Bradyrhizobium sp.]|uniref:hypothetical protein n=1 Tax=Bradyrhizobium sp. TaxID=376 RepID=UPI0025B7CF45|nr:hypothetical protein [Bradyrhizobium sp.]